MTTMALFNADELLGDISFTDRYYQIEAVGNTVAGLRDGGRGQLRMACGTGKTLVALWVAQRLLSHGGVVVMLCPSIGLVNQILRVWSENNSGHAALAVCSDDDVSYGDTAGTIADITLAEVTTDAEEIADWLRRNRNAPLRLIVGTYRSCEPLGQGLIAADRPADLLILDEAHHTAGWVDKQCALVHHDVHLPALRRLYMTATPRVSREDKKAKPLVKRGPRDATDDDQVLSVGMDDESVFGPVLYRYTFAKAIEDKYLDDYQVVIVGVTEADVLAVLRKADNRATLADARTSLRTAMLHAAIARAARRFSLRRVLTFCPQVADSKDFERTFASTLRQLPEDKKPAARLVTGHIDGNMPFDQRRKILDKLAEPADDEWVVVSNVRCLTEGVDVPAIDAVAFTSKKESQVEIVQALSRALRPNPDGSGVATIMIPVAVADYTDDDDANDTEFDDEFADQGYGTVWQVVRALRTHDDVLGHALDDCRAKGAITDEPQLERFLVDLPEGMDHDGFLRRLTARIVKATTSRWWESFGRARAYYDKHGCLPIYDDVVDETGFRLSKWLSMNRELRNDLTEEQRAALDSIGMAWDSRVAQWWNAYSVAERYFREFGHLDPPSTWRVPDEWNILPGFYLWGWIRRQSELREAGVLDAEQIAALDRIGIKWNDGRRRTFDDWVAIAAKFRRENGHLNPSPSDNFDLWRWLWRQRDKRAKGEQTEQRIAALDAIGIDWTPVPIAEVRWYTALDAVANFKKTYGHFLIPVSHPRVDGIDISTWLRHQLNLHRKNELLPARHAALVAIGVEFTDTERGGRRLQRNVDEVLTVLARFGGEANVPKGFKTDSGLVFHTWCKRQRARYVEGTLSEKTVTQLAEAGLDLTPRRRTKRSR